MTYKRSHVLGLITTTGYSLLALPLYAILFMFGRSSLMSHPMIADNDTLDCSRFPDSCIGPQYHKVIIVVAIVVALLVLSGWLGQLVARFPRQGKAVALLSLYGGLVAAVSLAGIWAILSVTMER